jgi:hypothetical protein
MRTPASTASLFHHQFIAAAAAALLDISFDPHILMSRQHDNAHTYPGSGRCFSRYGNSTAMPTNATAAAAAAAAAVQTSSTAVLRLTILAIYDHGGIEVVCLFVQE